MSKVLMSNVNIFNSKNLIFIISCKKSDSWCIWRSRVKQKLSYSKKLSFFREIILLESSCTQITSLQIANLKRLQAAKLVNRTGENIYGVDDQRSIALSAIARSEMISRTEAAQDDEDHHHTFAD